jgi:hypothetical protein
VQSSLVTVPEAPKKGRVSMVKVSISAFIARILW